jgi:hypothetical protein
MDTIRATTTAEHLRNGAAMAGGLQGPHAPGQFAPSGTADEAARLLAEAHAARVSRCTLADYLRFVVVAIYLGGVMAWLVASRQIRPNFSVRRNFRAFLFRHRTPTPLSDIIHDAGHCYRATVDPAMLSDAESISRVQVYEDGVPLPTPHSDHAAIRRHGNGRYSHWTEGIYFSASDNTDPRRNGRRYVYKEVSA